MKDLLILGIGVHACEMAEIVDRSNNKNYNLLGFVDKVSHREELMGYPVYGVEDLEGRFSHAVIVPDNSFELEFKQKYLERMVSLVDPSCFVSRTAKLGRGCVLYPGCFVGHNAVIEDFVFSLSGSIINHDDVVGTGAVVVKDVAPNSVMAGNPARVLRK